MAWHIVDIETKSETEAEPNLREFFVIIRGPLGAGKTTASLKLSEAIGAAYVSIDDIWKEITLKSGGELTLRREVSSKRMKQRPWKRWNGWFKGNQSFLMGISIMGFKLATRSNSPSFQVFCLHS